MNVACCARRAAALEELFIIIERTRMAGLPVLHPGLRVQAVGFEPADDEVAIGVLVTPWFMNLVRFPLEAGGVEQGVGRTETVVVGGEAFDFIGAFEPGFGGYSACSLFSPMFEFADQAAALATAEAVLRMLRPGAAASAAVEVALPVTAVAPAARRAFLFGRGGLRA